MGERKARKHRGVAFTPEERAEVALDRLELSLSTFYKTVPYTQDFNLMLLASQSRFEEWRTAKRVARKKAFEGYRPNLLPVSSLPTDDLETDVEEAIEEHGVSPGSETTGQR